MRYIIVSDSSSNVFQMERTNYTSVPMKINFDGREYVDAPGLDVGAMVAALRQCRGKSGSSCPNVQDWLDAFGDADMVFCVTITKQLSGSYNSARQALKLYLEEHPERRGYVFDSMATGPEQAMLAERIGRLAEEGHAFETIVEKTLDYHDHTHTLFRLQSLANLARNGRVNPAVAKIAGVLGIRLLGEAQNGQIAALHKPRGDKKAIPLMAELIRERGFHDGSVLRISHCFNQEAALELRDLLLADFPNLRFTLEPTTALCSFYAEEGGLIVGFEGSFNPVNHTKMAAE